MAASEVFDVSLRLAARRAYERGRLRGALLRGAAVMALALPGLQACNRSPLAIACLAGLGLVVVAGHVRGEGFAEGSRSGALAGILPCLLPAAIGSLDPQACMLMMSSNGLWICAIGGAAAGVLLGLRSGTARGPAFWAPAMAALALAASIGCLSAGAIGFGGLAAGVIVGGTPVLILRRAHAA
jgi:hypothetical protein